jgi:hypothetical protein
MLYAVACEQILATFAHYALSSSFPVRVAVVN